MENSNLSAFPISKEDANEYSEELPINTGLTKREYFAAMAMQGILASCFKSFNPNPQDVAEDSIIFADALLTALNKKD